MLRACEWLRRAATVAAALLIVATGAAPADDPAPAEIALFMTDHLGKLTPPARLRYAFRRSGTLEQEFSDNVEVNIEAAPDGRRSIVTRCLSAERKLELPALDFAKGNPALLCFLESDIRHMERLTGSRASHFRQRIRLALAQNADVRDVKLDVGGRQIVGREIRIAPYLDDPRRSRFERYAAKHYVFRVSDEVPGGIVAVGAVIPDDSGPAAKGKPNLLVDEMKLTASAADEEGKPQQ